MSFLLTRMFAYFTLVMYLVVGTVAVRVLAPEMTTVEISSSYFKFFSKIELNETENIKLELPELAFKDIEFPIEKVTAAKAKPVPIIAKVVLPVTRPELKYRTVVKNELPFYEPVHLEPVFMNNELPQNFASIYTEFKYEMVAEVRKEEITQDEISSSLAANAEPEFFEYETSQVASEEAPIKQEEPSISPEIANNVGDVQNIDNDQVEEIAVNDLISFDYSKAKADLKEQTMPVISTVTTQATKQVTMTPVIQKVLKPSKAIVDKKTNNYEPIMDSSVKKGLAPKEVEETSTFTNRMTIQVTGTDLVNTQKEVGFEIRFQDDQNEAIQDYNSGAVTLDQSLATKNMTRSISILKRGFVPTNTDLILEEGEAEVTLPLINEEVFNRYMEPFESRGPIGAVLVELDEEIEDASLDVPYSQLLKLDAGMRITSEGDYTYLMFVGAKAGNALLTFKDFKQERVSKIIHIHDREVTFESSLIETVKDEKIKLVEEDLLSKEKHPLMLLSKQVKQFATEKFSKKLNNHTYKMDYRTTVLGARKYLELNHQSEPVFVGFKENATIEVPSENFMRFILTRFEGASLGSRCLVQINLGKKADKFDIGSESVQASLMISAQVLDTDGKFYESIGEKSTKIIIVGEHQGSPELGQDGKINIKISYRDGSEQYLGSYCSPNTYLVEQL